MPAGVVGAPGLACPTFVILPGFAGPSGGGDEPALARPAAVRARSASIESAPPRRRALVLIWTSSNDGFDTGLYSAAIGTILFTGGRFTKALRCLCSARFDRPPGLDLERVPRVSVAEVRERHRNRMVLELPDVAELVRHEVLGRLRQRLPEEDHVPRGVAVEASEPGQPEEQGRDEDAHPVDAHRPRIPLEPVEPCLRPPERCSASGAG